jgi:hypothetical protein
MGLDQYRPALGSLGNLSDVLFLCVFLAGGLQWLVRLDAQRLDGLLRTLLELEPLIWGGVLVTLGAAIASLGSNAPSPSWSVTLKYFSMFCVWLPWVTVALRRYLSVRTAYVLYVAGFGFVAIATIADLQVGTRFGGLLVSTPVYEVDWENLMEGVRYGGPTGHPNTLGYLSAIGFLLSLSVIVLGTGKKRWVSLLALGAFGATLLVSGSRAAFLGVVAGCVVLTALGGRAGRRRVLLVGVACILTLWILSSRQGLPAELNPVERLAQSVQPRRSFEADWQRRRDLELTERLLSHDPLTGFGMEDIVPHPPMASVGIRLPHFIVLQSWVAGGVLALVGTLWLYGVALWLGWRAVQRRQLMAVGLFSACVAFVVMDQVHPGLDQRFKWFSVALLAAYLQDVERGDGTLVSSPSH